MQHFPTCTTVALAWGVGAGPTFYPEVAGYSIGAQDDPVYIMLEIHYDNPNIQSGVVDNSGMRLTYTDTLREFDVGILTQGVQVQALNFIVPPKQEFYQLTGHCQSNCFDKVLTKAEVDRVTAFAVFPHTHLTGRSVRVRHFRNGRELPYLLNNMAYDFNYQEYVLLQNPATLGKDDSIMTECVYNTLDRDHITMGGFGSYEEMCLSFILYYPKLDISHCISTAPYQTSWPKLGINTSEVQVGPGGNMDLRQVFYRNQTIFDYFNQIDWTPESVEVFNGANDQMYRQFCIPMNRSQQFVSEHEVEEYEYQYVPDEKQCLDLKPTSTPANHQEDTTSDGGNNSFHSMILFIALVIVSQVAP